MVTGCKSLAGFQEVPPQGISVNHSRDTQGISSRLSSGNDDFTQDFGGVTLNGMPWVQVTDCFYRPYTGFEACDHSPECLGE
jgi:hypothetical protein